MKLLEDGLHCKCQLKNVDLSKVIVCVGLLTAALLIAVLGVASRTIYKKKLIQKTQI